MQRSRVNRFMNQASISTKVSEHIKGLEDAWHKFDVRTLCRIQHRPVVDVRTEDGVSDLAEQASRGTDGKNCCVAEADPEPGCV